MQGLNGLKEKMRWERYRVSPPKHEPPHRFLALLGSSSSSSLGYGQGPLNVFAPSSQPLQVHNHQSRFRQGPLIGNELARAKREGDMNIIGSSNIKVKPLFYSPEPLMWEKCN